MFKLKNPIKLEANKQVAFDIIGYSNSNFQTKFFTKQVGDLILKGVSILDIDFDLYFWT